MQLRKTQFFNITKYFGGKGNFSTVYACSLVSVHNVIFLLYKDKTEMKIKTERDINKNINSSCYHRNKIN